MDNGTTKGKTTMKKEHTIESLRANYKAIARLAIARGMSKDSFRTEVKSWFDDISDGEAGENALKDAAQYCIAARRVAVENGVTKEELRAAGISA